MRMILLFFFSLCLASCGKKEIPKPKPVPVKVTKAIQKDIPVYNSYIGQTKATVEVEIQSQVEGVLTGYYFTEGQEVKKGDLLFTIDDRPYVAQLAKAEAGLARSLANLNYAEDVAQRNMKLAQKDYVSTLQYDQYLTNVMTSSAEIKQNEADIETAKINISYCNIHAPDDGITGVLKINVGNLIKNAEETPLIILNKITPIYTYFSVPQKDLPEIMKLSKQEPLVVQAFLNKDYNNPFVGKLDLIDNQVNEKTGSIWLRGIFENGDKMLWPGEFVDVELILKIEKNAVIVPTETVSLGIKGKYVFIIDKENKADLRYIKVGKRLGDVTIISDGVEAGDLVVTEGQINLSPGREVAIIDKQEN